MGKANILGAMQNWSLTVDKFVDHAARWHGSTQIVSRKDNGEVLQTNWADLRDLSKRISNALLAENIKQGDRIATLAMNGANHLASWYGIMGIGAVCHTLNPRLAIEQLEYIVSHAGDRIILADRAFGPIIEELRRRCDCIERIVWLDEEEGNALDGLGAFIAGFSAECPWGQFDENTPAALCYTSGTTGRPKGVLYSHRSNYLHTMMTLQPDVFGLRAGDSCLPIVPMFHANAWGLVFSAAAVGAKLVLPGRHVDGPSLAHLMQSEMVTMTAGVPTVLQGLADHLQAHDLKLEALERIIVGGSACPPSLFDEFENRGVSVRLAWGMTETSPLGTSGALANPILDLPDDARKAILLKQGRVPVGVDIRIVDETGRKLPHDGQAPGFLQVRGHSVVEAYFSAENSALTPDGFFDTGDVATIDPYGFVKLTDRAKDMIKSGGEWISSVDMENAVMSHPQVETAAVIAMPHPKWGERPILLVKSRDDADFEAEELRALLSEDFAKWELPDEILFVREIPLGATGKVDKKALRAAHGENRLPLV